MSTAAFTRALTLPLIGMSAALLVLGFWGPSVDLFYEQAWLFSAGAIVTALIAMGLATAALKSPGSVTQSATIGVATGTALLVPGAIVFGIFGLALGPIALVPGLAAASFLFPKGKRLWIAPLWIVPIAMSIGSGFVAAVLTDPGANSSEGVGMAVFRTMVWLAVLACAVPISAFAERFWSAIRSESRAEQALPADGAQG